MNSKKPRITYLVPTSPNRSYYGYSSDNTFDTINDTIPSYRSIIHIGTYSLSPNQTSSTKQTSRQTSLSPKIQKSISPPITRKPPPIRRLNSIKITRKNRKTNKNNNKCNIRVPSIINLMSSTTNNSHTTELMFNPSYIEMPYIENEDDVSSSYYDNNEGTNSIQHELALSTPGHSAISLSSNFNNSSNISYTSLHENETLIHATTDEIDEKIEITNSNHNNIIFENNKDDIINQQNKIINDLQIQLKNSKNKINILNKKLDNYEEEMHELIDSVNMFADEATTYKKTINILQKQLTNLQGKQYNQFSELSISNKSRRNSKRISKTESKRQRRRSRTWISKHELNIKEMNNIKEYELNDNININESDDSFVADWSCALSVLNSDNSNQYKYNQNDLFYD
eukprot:347969_1